MADYSLYLVECADGSLYTGIAVDVDRRFGEHQAGRRGAKYLRGRGPLKLVFRQPIGERGLAQRVEARVRRLPRSMKADPARLLSMIRQMLEEIDASQ